MAKTAVDALIDELLERMDWPDDASHQASALKALNDAEKFISQKGSFHYLKIRTSLSLVNTASSVNVPSSPAINIGKPIVLIDPTLGALDFKPDDVFAQETAPTTDLIVSDRPFAFNIASDGTDMKFFFDRSNTTGSSISYTIIYQRLVAALTDSGSSYSLLPETYENTILMDRAEIIARRKLGRPIPQWMIEEHREALAMFYDEQRITKEEAMAAVEVEQRKLHSERTGPEAY